MSIKRVLGALGLIALVAVIAVLVAVAMHRHSDGTQAKTGIPTGTPTQVPGPDTPVDAQGLDAVSKTPTPFLSVANAKYALFGTGGCHGTPLLYAVAKNGKKIIPGRSPATHIVRLAAETTTHAYLIGAAGHCRLTRYNTTDSGFTWTKARRLGGVWSPTRDGVRGPSGAVGHPCASGTEPVALAPAGTKRAIVICRRGVFETTTGPTGWTPAGKLPTGQPAAVTLLPNGHGALLLASQGSCLGLRLLTTTDTGQSWTSGQCLARSHAPVALSISARGDGLLISTGQKYTTSNGGKTWVKYTPHK
jgi:hypothetical protein